MTRSQPASAASSPADESFACAAVRSSPVSLPLATRRSRLLSMVASPLASAEAWISTSTTSKPDCAATCAMPLPIVPAPTTPTLRISMLEASISTSSPCRAEPSKPRGGSDQRRALALEPGLEASELRSQRGAHTDERRRSPHPDAGHRHQLDQSEHSQAEHRGMQLDDPAPRQARHAESAEAV